MEIGDRVKIKLVDRNKFSRFMWIVKEKHPQTLSITCYNSIDRSSELYTQIKNVKKVYNIAG